MKNTEDRGKETKIINTKLLGLSASLAIILSGFVVANANAGQVITSGSGVEVGVFDAGSIGDLGRGLYAPFATGGSPPGDAILPGCLCEGWGVAGNGTSGNVYAGVMSGITLVGTASGVNTFTSTTQLTSLPSLQITQTYSASADSAAFVVDKVTITNTGGATITGVQYARNMDWDIPPTNFSEFVTIQGWPATAMLHSSNDGFAASDPLSPPGSICAGAPVDANFTESGACDHGAWFSFGFGDLAPGQSTSFDIFYGAAPTKKDAMAALAAIGAEVYSLGYSTSVTGGPDYDAATFIFAFTGVGGTPVPEPASLALMGLGLAALATRRRRQVQA